MRILGKRYSAKEWARLAMTFGLFVTDAKIWSAINDQLGQRADHLADLIRHESDRTIAVGNQQLRFRQNRDWMAHLTSLLAGTAVKNNVGDAAARATQFRSEARPTGAVGD